MAVQLTYRLATIMLAVIAVGATVIVTFAVLSSGKNIRSFGTIKAVNVGVYWDSGCTSVTSTVDWGKMSPGDIKNVTLYMKNEGNVAVKLSLAAQNWNPANAPNYISLSWNREGQIVDTASLVAATLTLSVSWDISGITDFSFDMVITGTE